MDFSKEVARTWNSDLTEKEALSNACMGLAGESGEVIDEVKKYLYHGKELNLQNVLIECGDCIYYMQALLNTLPGDYSLADCQEMVIEKLKKRHPGKFSGDYHKDQVSDVEVWDE